MFGIVHSVDYIFYLPDVSDIDCRASSPNCVHIKYIRQWSDQHNIGVRDMQL
jgi:hypothetical protein